MLWSRWGCIDIDENNYELATQFKGELDEVGISAYVESSKSKGWHVWVFHEDWMEVKYTRALLLWLVTDLGYPKMEVFPKQFDLDVSYLGSLHMPFARPVPFQYLSKGQYTSSIFCRSHSFQSF